MTFDAIRYPLSVQSGTSTVSFNTTIIEEGNGSEVRIANWDEGRVEVNAAHGIRSLKDLRELYSFHRRRKGRARSFLIRDLVDYEVGQDEPQEGVFGTGDGTTKIFQLRKNYVDAYNTDQRVITKPEQGTVSIFVDGLEKTEGLHYTINYLTGKITFVTAPALNAVLEWTGRFFVAVRFTEDKLPVDEFMLLMVKDPDTGEYVVDRGGGPIPDILLIEDRDA
ncbi:MAG TPA: TIGR02217 family protein [Pyrinomonadaceae bacterium]|jgi:uncharacterized protein (TIGR02217 family)